MRKCCKPTTTLSDGKQGVVLDNGVEIELPPEYVNRTNFAEIIDVGQGCEVFNGTMARRHRDGPGALVFLPEIVPNEIHCVDLDRFEYWIVKETDLPSVVFTNGEILPLGTSVVLEIEAKREEKGILKPDGAEFKLLPTPRVGTVVAVGTIGIVEVGTRVIVRKRLLTFSANGKLLAVCQASDLEGAEEP
jgi:co-chaperonin GroES (HSP10)